MMLHVRYDGKSIDYPLRNLDLGIESSDSEVRRVAAQRLDQPTEKFSHFVVDRNTETGDLTLRPQAVFG